MTHQPVAMNFRPMCHKTTGLDNARLACRKRKMSMDASRASESNNTAQGDRTSKKPATNALSRCMSSNSHHG
ncbi:hypothetical protein PIB30_077185 [Stylosanthes scabra]|uniref:Uncharacterized protein n=1 Tax=Stylosanthes scabra TaxID=79078 RepID=A0ABU6UPX3_9FABA|nr:hypothetical protein [Stylosanthes scabra]